MNDAIKYSLDHRQVTVQITENPDVFIKMDVEQIAMLMRRLISLRHQMQPPVPTRLTRRESYLGTTSPAWAVEKQSDGPGILFHIREPGIGWLHFNLNPDEARSLGELLISSALETPKRTVN